MVERVESDGFLYALIIRKDYCPDGINFFSADDDILQVGTMKHTAGHTITPHRHLPYKRETEGTQEVLFIKKGTLKAIFFDSNDLRVNEVILTAGDLIVLLGGAHGFDIIDDLEMIEVKNGPYAVSGDKTRFEEN